MKKKNFKILILLSFFVVVFLALTIFGYNFMLNPNSEQSQEVNFVVHPNDNLTTISNNLEADDVIKSGLVLKIHGKISKVSDFVEGAYTVDKNWDAKKVLSHLTKGENVIPNEVTVTLREGLWAKEMADKISMSVDVNKDDLLELWNDTDYIKSLMSEYPFLTDKVLSDVLTVKLEGYLAPNTYNFFIDTDAKTITNKILDQTLIIYNKYADLFNESDYSIHEIFSLAALTQYESGNFDDDQLISGIWYNRLNKGMRLESSVTVCYALYEFDSWEDCEQQINYESPYNTYKNPGIPPGPVTNPGEGSILATLKPLMTDYYFFMADVKGDSKVYYSETFEEHQKKVNKYLR